MKVMIATPCYGFACTPIYTASLVRTVVECQAAGMPTYLEMLSDAMVTRARNKLVARFLADRSFTHLFFVDADVGFSPEAFARLLLADRDVAAGVYPLKRYDWPEGGLPAGTTQAQFDAIATPYPFNAIDGRLVSDDEGFGLVAEAPTGFMCIKREVFDKMMLAYPLMRYVPEEMQPARPQEGAEWLHWLFFDSMVDMVSMRYLSEDYAFCHRWRALGGDVWIDLHSKLNHQGPHIWRGDLLDSLRAGGGRARLAQ